MGVTRKAVLKRKKECVNCKSFVGNRKTFTHGECSKGLKTTCYRQNKKRCEGYEFDSKWDN